MGERASGWVVRDTKGGCMYICLCMSVYVNMYLCVWYHNSSSQNKSRNNYGSLQEFPNSFPYVI